MVLFLEMEKLKSVEVPISYEGSEKCFVQFFCKLHLKKCAITVSKVCHVSQASQEMCHKCLYKCDIREISLTNF